MLTERPQRSDTVAMTLIVDNSREVISADNPDNPDSNTVDTSNGEPFGFERSASGLDNPGAGAAVEDTSPGECDKSGSEFNTHSKLSDACIDSIDSRGSETRLEVSVA
jgi:hypothetical protein